MKYTLCILRDRHIPNMHYICQKNDNNHTWLEDVYVGMDEPRHSGQIVRALASSVEGKDFETRPSQSSDLQRLSLSPPSLAFSFNRIGQ